MNILSKNVVIVVILMISTSLGAIALTPTVRLADIGNPLNLDKVIPQNFGDWQEYQQTTQIVDPQKQEYLKKFYGKILNRTYVNRKGDAIMLSIAYGEEQSDEKQVHYPEVCYPAQGFKVVSIHPNVAKTSFGNIRVKRVETELGERKEPLTYWTTVGNNVVLGGFETKKIKLSYGFKGYIPDGLLFRVSSISNDSNSAFQIQQNFIAELMTHIDSETRLRISGLTGK